MVKKDFMASVIPCSARPLVFDETKCIGCNRCANICQVDILIPNEEKGKPPVVLYPGECYYCGSCVMVCPNKGAIKLSHPLMNQAKFVPVKDTKISLRQEREEDYDTVERVVREAFWNHYGPGCDEHFLLNIMRNHEDFVPELDIVALVNDTLAGQIAYTKAKIAADSGKDMEVLCFGPLSVLPEYQNHGIGQKLIKYSIEKAAQLGYKAVLIYGDPDYYKKSGFVPAKTFGIANVEDMYADALLALELEAGVLEGCSGRFMDSDVFKMDKGTFESYDMQFPQKDKVCGLPSQKRFRELASRQEKR